MKGINILPPNILGLCHPKTKTILINTQKSSLPLSLSELERLTQLGESCIKIAQVVNGEKIRAELKYFGDKNVGSKEFPISSGWTSMYGFAGVIGGLEIYGSQMCDGPRYSSVRSNQEEVFSYNCDGVSDDGSPRNPQITVYIKGNWEEKVVQWYNEINENFRQRVLTPPFW